MTRTITAQNINVPPESPCIELMEGPYYVGESKIIRTVGTYFAFGYTAGWA